MALSWSAVWSDTARILRANAALLVALAGAFLFLPALLLGYFLPVPTGQTVTPQIAAAYYREHFGWILLSLTVQFVGNLAILILALDESRPTVAGALRAALALLWRYFNVTLLTFLAMVLAFLPASIWFGALAAARPGLAVAGAALLAVPALWVIGRLSVAPAAVVAERGQGALAAIRRSIALTRGAGWAVVGMLLLVIATFGIVRLAATTVLGSLFLLLDAAAGGGGIGALLLLILDAAIGALFNVILFVLVAAIYRALAAGAPAAASGT